MHSVLQKEKIHINEAHYNNDNICDKFGSTTAYVKGECLVQKEKEVVEKETEESIDVDGSDGEDLTSERSRKKLVSGESSNDSTETLNKSYIYSEYDKEVSNEQFAGTGDYKLRGDDSCCTFYPIDYSKPENLSKLSCDIYESGKNKNNDNLGILGQKELMMIGSSILGRHLMYLSYLNYLAAQSKAQEATSEVNASESTCIYDCSVCKRSFDQKGTLRAHMESCHKGMRFHCSDCGKKFSSRSCLKLHVDSLHKGLKYDCSVCGKSFTQKGHLNIHVESIHNRVKFDCHICSRVFSQKSTLKVHVDSVHKGLKYVCSICDQSFNWRIQLKQHIGLHHDGVKFTCKICNINLYHKRSLNKHMALFH